MLVQAWTEGKGFSLVIDYPNRKFVLIPNAEGEGVSISTSYNELFDLQNLISERLADFRLLREKESLKTNEMKP